jgi:hypothetical protein
MATALAEREVDGTRCKSEIVTNNYSMHCGDSCKLIKKIGSDRIHYSIFSPPFVALFVYSDDPEDMGNCSGKEEFFEHFSFLVPELYRVTMPGRLCTVHSMQLPTTKQHHGEIGIHDFPGDIIRMFESHGWIYHSRVIIWKDPLVAATRTKAIGLAHKQICKDSCRCRQGVADYLDTFLKPGDNPEPVATRGKTAGFDRFIGDADQLTTEERELMKHHTSDARTNKYSHVVWRRYASPVWMDIRQTRVVGNEPGTVSYIKGRDTEDERHCCPLQLDVYDRCIELWTNQNDVVLEPFGGVGSGAFSACSMGRRYMSFELKRSYFDIAILNASAGVQKWNSARLPGF